MRYIYVVENIQCEGSFPVGVADNIKTARHMMQVALNGESTVIHDFPEMEKEPRDEYWKTGGSRGVVISESYNAQAAITRHTLNRVITGV